MLSTKISNLKTTDIKKTNKNGKNKKITKTLNENKNKKKKSHFCLVCWSTKTKLHENRKYQNKILLKSLQL